MGDPLDLTTDDLQSLSDYPALGAGYVLPDGSGLPITEPRTDPDVEPTVWLVSLPELKARLFPDAKAGVAPAVTLAPIGTGTVNVSLALAATVTVAVGSDPITKVEFFAGTTKIAEASTAPYAASYVPAQAGNVYLTAKATDQAGRQGLSQPQLVVVNAGGTATNLPPTVSLTVTPTTTTVGQAVSLAATAADPDGSVASVEFYVGGTKIATAASSPYTAAYVPQLAGSFTLTAKATDNLGVSTTTTQTLTVTAASTQPITPEPPTQSSDDTANTQDFDSPYGKSEIVVSINNGAFGTYAGPYQVGNVNRPFGYYRAKVRAATGRTESGITSSLAFTVATPANQLPLVNAGADASITLPTNQIGLVGTASDPDGTVVSYQWTQITGPNTATGLPAATQNVLATNLIAGIYQFRLTVTDNSGGVSTDDVLVTVNAASTPTLQSAVITGPASVANPSTTTYTVTGTYSDSSVKQVTSGITWGSNTPGGVLTVASGSTATSATVTASVGGITAPARTITIQAAALPTFNTIYNPGDNKSTATWSAAPGWQLLLNLPLSTNTDPNPATMLVFAPDGTQIGQFDYAGWDTGAGFAVKDTSTNTTYYHTPGGALLTLASANVTLAV